MLSSDDERYYSYLYSEYPQCGLNTNVGCAISRESVKQAGGDVSSNEYYDICEGVDDSTVKCWEKGVIGNPVDITITDKLKLSPIEYKGNTFELYDRGELSSDIPVFPSSGDFDYSFNYDDALSNLSTTSYIVDKVNNPWNVGIKKMTTTFDDNDFISTQETIKNVYAGSLPHPVVLD